MTESSTTLGLYAYYNYHSRLPLRIPGIRGFHVSSCILGVVSVVIDVDPKTLNNYLRLQIYILKWMISLLQPAATTTAGLEVEIGGLEFWIFSKL